MTDPTGELPVDTLVDLGFTVADATILAYYNAQAIYNQFMAIQNIDNYEVYRSYQDKANEYEQKAGEKLADLGMDAISTATPYVSAGITRSAKMAFQAAEKARDAKKVEKGINITTAKITEMAQSKGYAKTNEYSHGQAVYYNSKNKTYITHDKDSHIGGVWKMAKSVKDLQSKETRMGTYDLNLKKIGD